LAGNDVLRTIDDVSVIFLLIFAILEAKETKMGFALLIPALYSRTALEVEKGLKVSKILIKSKQIAKFSL
jgi:hypothetical protein